MEYISSDTNIWLDFMAIGRLKLPFKLPYIYLMEHDAAEDELLNPPEIRKELMEMGLQKTELTEEEFFWQRNWLGNILSRPYMTARRWRLQK